MLDTPSPTISSTSSMVETQSVAARDQDRWIMPAALLAVVLKLLLAWNTLGTNDVLTFYIFAKALIDHGLEWTYLHTISFNHPPVTAEYLKVIYSLHHWPILQSAGMTFPFLLRLPGILADFAVVYVLARLNRERLDHRIPTWALIAFAVSPLSLMVSGYHGNTDAVMVLFLVLAAYFVVRQQPIFCGLFLALSVQIKIIPLLLFPIFLCYWFHRRKVLVFGIPFAMTSLVLWSEPILHFPRVFFGNVLSYSSYWGIWGFTYLLRLTGRPEFTQVSFFGLSTIQNVIITASKLVIIAAVLTLAWRRRKGTGHQLWESVAYAWIIFFILSPGVCTQYLIWLAPFVLLLSPRFYAALLVSSSLFAFAFYDTISEGIPWYRGISTNALNHIWTPWSLLPWLVLIALGIWAWRTESAKTVSGADMN